MKINKFFFTILILLFSSCLFAAPPGIPFEILSNGSGARVFSMGGASSANTDDASLVLWNPAYLDSITKNEIFLSFEPLFGSATYNFISYVNPAGKIGGFGIALAYAGYGKYEIMDKEGNSGGEASVSDLLFALAYGKNLFAGIQSGLNIKIGIKSFNSETFTGYNADIGFFRSFEFIDAGIVFKDVLPLKVKFSYEEESFTPGLKFGLCLKLIDEQFKITGDVEKYFNNTQPEIFAGLEYNLFKILYLRAGINSEAILSAGAGINYENFVFDYAILNNEVTLLHKFSLHYRFGGYEVGLKAEPEIFSPLSGNKKTYIRIIAKTKYDIYKWRVELKNAKGEIVKTWEGAGQPFETVIWDGLKPDGLPFSEGDYKARLILTDENDTVIKSEEINIKLSSAEKFFMPLMGE